jgi:hypothetical protein
MIHLRLFQDLRLLMDNSLGGLRSAAFVAVLFGSIGSIGLLRHAQQRTPPMLVMLFVIWVAAPFILLGIANVRSPRWPRRVQLTLCIITLIVTIGSLLIYLDDNMAHRTTKAAFVWVAVPPASVLVSVIAVGIAALMNKASASK